MIRPKTREQDDSCRRGDRGSRRLRSLREIVEDYKRRFRPRASRELRHFRRMRNLEAAIAEAGMARMPDGKRCSHQRRLSEPVLEYATAELHHANLKSARSFEELLTLVEVAAGRLRGIGEMYMYDTALRVGAYLRKLPDRVYLHAGTRIGAAALGFDIRVRSIELQKLPVPLRRLKPHEIEDVLCIYREWLAGVRAVGNRE